MNEVFGSLPYKLYRIPEPAKELSDATVAWICARRHWRRWVGHSGCVSSPRRDSLAPRGVKKVPYGWIYYDDLTKSLKITQLKSSIQGSSIKNALVMDFRGTVSGTRRAARTVLLHRGESSWNLFIYQRITNTSNKNGTDQILRAINAKSYASVAGKSAYLRRQIRIANVA